MINKAPLLMVPAGLVMCQEMFQLFVQHHPEYKNWQAIQKGFLSLGLHQVNKDGSFISRVEQVNNQQMYSGVVVTEFAVALPETVEVVHVNTGRVEKVSATELIHKSPFANSFVQQQHVAVVPPLQKLSTTGAWENIEQKVEKEVSSFLTPGMKRGA